MEQRLALLTTVSEENEDLSLSNIYPDKHEVLSIAGQIKPGKKMQALHKVLNDNLTSGPARLDKRLLAVNKRDSFFIVKYASLGKNHRPINQVIRRLRNEFKLKWLHLHVVYSRHSNLQEKLLGDLKRKLCGASWTLTLVAAHATVHGTTKETGYVPKLARHHPAEPPLWYAKLHVKLMVAIAFILVNPNDMLKMHPGAHRWGG